MLPDGAFDAGASSVCGKSGDGACRASDLHHDAHEDNELHYGFVVDLVVLVKERLPTIDVGKLLLDAHDMSEILGKVGGDGTHHCKAARDAGEKREPCALLGLKIDGVDRHTV